MRAHGQAGGNCLSGSRRGEAALEGALNTPCVDTLPCPLHCTNGKSPEPKTNRKPVDVEKKMDCSFRQLAAFVNKTHPTSLLKVYIWRVLQKFIIYCILHSTSDSNASQYYSVVHAIVLIFNSPLIDIQQSFKIGHKISRGKLINNLILPKYETKSFSTNIFLAACNIFVLTTKCRNIIFPSNK